MRVTQHPPPILVKISGPYFLLLQKMYQLLYQDALLLFQGIQPTL